MRGEMIDPVSTRTASRARILVTVVGVVITCLAMSWAKQPRGVYWSRQYVQFLAPYSATNRNVVRTSSVNLVMTAGVVARKVDPSGGKKRLVDDSVTLASEGITHGWAVTLPGSGTQWTHSFGDPLVQIEAVGSSAAEVGRTETMVLKRVRTAFTSLQRSLRPAQRNDISLAISPGSVPPIFYQAGRPSRAVAAAGMLGLAGTLFARLLVTQWLTARRRTPAMTPKATRQPVPVG